jgi:hypothetical protein
VKISKYWKAVIAGVAAGSGSLGTAVQDGALTQAEGVTAVLVAVAALGAVWRVPNREPEDRP